MSEANMERLERLKKISDNVSLNGAMSTHLRLSDLLFLIEQAELAQMSNGVAIYHNEFLRVSKQNDSLRERLKEKDGENKCYRESIKEAIAYFNQDEHQLGMAELQKALRK